MSALDVVAVEIDTCELKPWSAFLFKHAQKIATLSCAFANKMVPWSQRRRHRSTLLLYSHTEAELQYLHVPMAAVVAVKFGVAGYEGGCGRQVFKAVSIRSGSPPKKKGETLISRDLPSANFRRRCSEQMPAFKENAIGSTRNCHCGQ